MTVGRSRKIDCAIVLVLKINLCVDVEQKRNVERDRI